ncbi:MAG: hypothetical protein ACSLEY_04125 [Candidatus Saccharimonadales bacterium]
MSNTSLVHHKKPSKLEEFKLGFEYNRTLKEERKLTQRRTYDVS